MRRILIPGRFGRDGLTSAWLVSPVLLEVVVVGREFADEVGLAVRCSGGDRDSAQDGEGAGQGVGPGPAFGQA